MNLKETIKKILREETEEHKVNLVKKIIYTLYDNISFIEESTYDGRPLLIIYFESDDTAANIESWFDEKISRDIREWTSESIVVCPNWAANWDWRKKNADVFINTELIKYDELGNVVNESVLGEETKPHKAMRRTHLIDNEIARLLDRVYFDKRICGRYDDADMFVRVVTEAVVENLYFNTFYMMDDTSLEWEKSVDFIYDYIKDSYSETLKDYFNNTCNERVDIDESLVTEQIEELGEKTKLEKSVMKFVDLYFKGKELPENFYGVVADVYDTEYGQGCNITFLMKKPFKLEDSDEIYEVAFDVKKLIRNFFSDEFKYGINFSTTTVDNYKELKKRIEDMKKGEFTEGEITEKCWPGYTQKGMKTMFGKRYPNCVKKTKKR